VSLDHAISVVAELAGRKLEVVRTEPQRGDVRDTGADITAARAALGFEPTVSLVEGLRAEWEWLLDPGRKSPAAGARGPGDTS
jgi:UDP-glucose 4-epimerase